MIVILLFFIIFIYFVPYIFILDVFEMVSNTSNIFFQKKTFSFNSFQIMHVLTTNDFISTIYLFRHIFVDGDWVNLKWFEDMKQTLAETFVKLGPAYLTAFFQTKICDMTIIN